jgi:hypothetical protein
MSAARLVLQDGKGEVPVGRRRRTPGSRCFWFVILFGVSMNYHVLIVSRSREAVDRGMSETRPSRTASSPPPAS